MNISLDDFTFILGLTGIDKDEDLSNALLGQNIDIQHVDEILYYIQNDQLNDAIAAYMTGLTEAGEIDDEELAFTRSNIDERLEMLMKMKTEKKGNVDNVLPIEKPKNTSSKKAKKTKKTKNTTKQAPSQTVEEMSIVEETPPIETPSIMENAGGGDSTNYEADPILRDVYKVLIEADRVDLIAPLGALIASIKSSKRAPRKGKGNGNEKGKALLNKAWDLVRAKKAKDIGEAMRMVTGKL